MLQTMRENAQGWIAKVIVAVIAFTFAIFGLESLAPNPGNPTVASVNGEDITEQQLYQAIEQQRRMMQQRFGRNFDPSTLDDAVLRQGALDQLVNRALLTQSVKEARLEVSQEILDDQIRNTPVFQTDGKFDPDRFQAMVRGAGMTPLQYRDAIREETLVNQQMTGLSGSEFVTQAELNQLLNLQSQQRDIAWLTLGFEKAQEAVDVSEEDARNFYEARLERYMTPETVSVSYIELSREALRAQIEIDEEEIAQRYQAMVAEQEAEQLPEASIVLIESNDERDDDAAEARAQEAYSKLHAGEDFATVARAYSDDASSANDGGNIGSVEEGFFGSAFDQALAGLKPGEYSAPVKTDFGYQIIRLNGYEMQDLPAYADMRDELVQELQDGELAVLFIEKSQKLADISFESADLQQPADELGLTIQSTDTFDRNGGKGFAANQKVVDAAFSDDVLNLGANSELLELDTDHVVVLRVKVHNPPEQLAFEKMRDSIYAEQRRIAASENLKAEAETLRVALQSGQNRAAVAEQTGAEWTELAGAQRYSNEAPQQILMDAFRLPHPPQGQASYGVVEMPSSGDIALVMLTAVTAGEVDEAGDDNAHLSRMLAAGEGRNLYSEMLRDLRAEASVKIK